MSPATQRETDVSKVKLVGLMLLIAVDLVVLVVVGMPA